MNVAVTAIEADGLPSDVQYDAVRLAQLSLGDVGPDPRTPDSFSGYAARAEIDWSSPELNDLRQRLLNRFPSPNQAVDEEFVRLIAMLQPRDGRVAFEGRARRHALLVERARCSRSAPSGARARFAELRSSLDRTHHLLITKPRRLVVLRFRTIVCGPR